MVTVIKLDTAFYTSKSGPLFSSGPKITGFVKKKDKGHQHDMLNVLFTRKTELNSPQPGYRRVPCWLGWLRAVLPVDHWRFVGVSVVGFASELQWMTLLFPAHLKSACIFLWWVRLASLIFVHISDNWKTFVNVKAVEIWHPRASFHNLCEHFTLTGFKKYKSAHLRSAGGAAPHSPVWLC